MPKNLSKLTLPALIFAVPLALLLTSCQTTPPPDLPEAIEASEENTLLAACQTFIIPSFPPEEALALSGDALNVLRLWDNLWVQFGCKEVMGDG